MSNDSTKAQRAQITLGDIPLNVYILPDGSYRLAGRNITDAIEMPNNSLIREAGVKSLKDLPGAGRISSITGEQVIAIPSKYAVEYWHLMALKGNTLAQNLLTQLRHSPNELTRFDTLNDIPIISERFSSTTQGCTSRDSFECHSPSFNSSSISAIVHCLFSISHCALRLAITLIPGYLKIFLFTPCHFWDSRL